MILYQCCSDTNYTGLDNYCNRNNYTAHHESDCNIAFFDLFELVNPFCQFVENVKGKVDCSDSQHNTKNELDEMLYQ